MMADHTTQMLYARGYDQAKRGESSTAATLYTRSRRHGRRGRFWPIRARDSRRLLDLSEVEDTCRVEDRTYAGLQTVSIEQIRGSEGRSSDFDRDFHPLQDHCKERWLRVATARDQDRVLPPVELVQVGNLYFVRDGHHRISVARTLGQLDIEAEVTVWQVSGPLPAEAMPGAAGGRARKPGPAAAWLQFLLPWRARARELAPTRSGAAA
jgi:hypothetical protein